MGKRGPAPTPTPILQMRGSWRAKTRANKPEPQGGRPICPTWLRKDAKRVWKKIAPRLDAMKVLGEIDRNSLARYCQIFAKWREAEEFLAKHGTALPVRNAAGDLVDFKQFPQVNLAMKLSDQLLRLEREFGMTPSARAAMATPPDKGKKDMTKEERYFGTGA